MREKIDTLGLVSAREIAEMFGVGRVRVSQLRRENEDFPTPVYDDRYTILWKREDAHAWGLAHGYIEEF